MWEWQKYTMCPLNLKFDPDTLKLTLMAVLLIAEEVTPVGLYKIASRLVYLAYYAPAP